MFLPLSMQFSKMLEDGYLLRVNETTLFYESIDKSTFPHVHISYDIYIFLLTLLQEMPARIKHLKRLMLPLRAHTNDMPRFLMQNKDNQKKSRHTILNQTALLLVSRIFVWPPTQVFSFCQEERRIYLQLGSRCCPQACL